MKSALVIRPQGHEDEVYNKWWFNLIYALRFLANETNKECRLLLQHDLKRDQMAISVEVGGTTLAGVGPDFTEAVSRLIQEIQKHRSKNEKLLAKKEQAAGEEGSKGHGGHGPKRKRLQRVRQR